MSLAPITSVKHLTDKVVLVRVDWNVPLKNGRVVDDFKIIRSLATIRWLQNKGAKVVLMSHLGRPVKPTPSLSLKPVARYVEKMLGCSIPVVPLIKPKDTALVQKAIDRLKRHSVLLLENIRFHADEEKNTGRLAKLLAHLGDMYVLDGFAVAHRSASSVTGVQKYLPSYAGLLLEEEMTVLSKIMDKPKRPLVVVLGGAKVDTKIPVLKHLLKKADYILLGGGLVNTYLWATGHGVGASIIGKEFKKDIIKYCANKKVIMPVDVIIGDEKGKKAYAVPLVQKLNLAKNQAIYDIGPASVSLFSRYIKKAQMLVWNGAMGKFEVKQYGYGTKALACLFAARSKGRAVGVVGGGETVELVQQLGLLSSIDLVSTGGGAMLEFLSGKKLPGVL